VRRLLLILVLNFLFQLVSAQNSGEIQWPKIVMKGIDSELKIFHREGDICKISVNGKMQILPSQGNETITSINITQSSDFKIYINDKVLAEKRIRPIPLWMSILPPLLAIACALIFKEVIISLFLGLYLGTLIPAVYSIGFAGIFTAFLPIIDTYIIEALYNTGHLSVILFSMIIGATVSLISKNGGMAGVVNRISVFAKSRRSGQMATWFLGIAIFFDDYANTLIVGNTMRPITDKLKISREKLSYIVDSTAAPVAAIAFITTWIGAELGYIQDGINAISGLNASVYHIFLNSLSYSYYPIFTLIFIVMIVLMKRDFGPMLVAENRMVSQKDSGDIQLIHDQDNEMKDFKPDDDVAKRSFNAIIPILTIILGTVWALLYTGWQDEVWSSQELGFIQKLSSTIGQSDPYLALLWSSLAGLLVASMLTLAQKLLTVQQTVGSILKGFKTMLTAMIILILAWSLSAETADMHTADFLSNLISGTISPVFLPLITFILASLVSFSTGSSWGTMAILYPLMLTSTWTLCQSYGLETAASLSIFYNVVACVLAGSVFGDHCSPISDTTILSSLASSCDHIEHVRTQLPYALTVGVIAMSAGTLPSAFGVSFVICLPTGILLMYFIIKKFGRDVSKAELS